MKFPIFYRFCCQYALINYPDLDDDDVGGRLDVLKEKMGRIGDITQSVAKMMTQFKSRLANVREQITSIQTGITFESSSKLELKAPDTIEELAVNTHVELFFNVTQSDVGR